jgi:hypothetical protein
MSSAFAILSCPHRKWLSHMFSDPLTISAGLTLTALNLLSSHPVPIVEDEHYRMAIETVRLINESLNDEKRRYSDQVIAGVMLLAANDVSCGSLKRSELFVGCD